MISTKLPKMFYGGDYNPEQWDQATHQEDLRMFKLAGIDIATINVFSWAKNQPDEITYNFGWLDELIDSLYESGVHEHRRSSRMDGNEIPRHTSGR